MSRKYFGTDGVRGLYGGAVMNETFAARLGYAAAKWAGGTGRVLIGRDTRQSGESLLKALAAGLRAAGMEPVSLGIVPTPAVALAVKHEHAALGVVITASHNPASDNGIKFFASSGVKLSDEDELRIESLFPDESKVATFADLPLEDRYQETVSLYQSQAASVLPKDCLRAWKVVLDTANGATTCTSAAVLRALGAEVVQLGHAPNGVNINAGVGSEHPALLAQRVCETGARFGIAHDGDGDRCILCDEAGSILDGDEILAILALHHLENKRLTENTLVVTVQSNLGLDNLLRSRGGRVHRTQVGDRYVIVGMRETGARLGGESSGHIICSEYSPTGDGLIAALSVIQVMLETGKPLSELRRVLVKFPQGTANLRVREKKALSELPGLSAEISAIERELGDQGRVLVRFSGTENKLRLLVEAPDMATVDTILARLQKTASQELEVLHI